MEHNSCDYNKQADIALLPNEGEKQLFLNERLLFLLFLLVALQFLVFLQLEVD